MTTTLSPAHAHANVLRVIGSRSMSAALIAAKMNDGHDGSQVHGLCYKLIRDGLLERHHNGRGWEYSVREPKEASK